MSTGQLNYWDDGKTQDRRDNLDGLISAKDALEKSKKAKAQFEDSKKSEIKACLKTIMDKISAAKDATEISAFVDLKIFEDVTQKLYSLGYDVAVIPNNAATNQQGTVVGFFSGLGFIDEVLKRINIYWDENATGKYRDSETSKNFKEMTKNVI